MLRLICGPINANPAPAAQILTNAVYMDWRTQSCFPEYLAEDIGAFDLRGMTVRDALLHVMSRSPVSGVTYIFENNPSVFNAEEILSRLWLMFPIQPPEYMPNFPLRFDPCESTKDFFMEVD